MSESKPPVIKEHIPAERKFWSRVVNAAIGALVTTAVSYYIVEHRALEVVQLWDKVWKKKEPPAAAGHGIRFVDACEIEKAFVDAPYVYVFSSFEPMPDGRIRLVGIRYFTNNGGWWQEAPMPKNHTH